LEILTLLKLGLSVPPLMKITLTIGQSNWSTFKNTLYVDIKLDISLKSIDEINDAVNNYTTSIQKVALEATKPYTIKNTKKQTPYHIQVLPPRNAELGHNGKTLDIPMTKPNLTN